MRPIILTFVNHYLPAYKSGGPLRSIANLVDQLGQDFRFRIVTRDRDAEDEGPFESVTVNDWNTVGKAQVFYASPEALRFRKLCSLIRSVSYDVLYLNSFFDPTFTVKPLLARRLRLIPDRPVVVAPRGEFSPGALQLKRWKKVPFSAFAKMAQLYKGIVWQASTPFEAEDIQRYVGDLPSRLIVVARDLQSASMDPSTDCEESRTQRGDALRMVYLSRITPMKNLDYALEVLRQVRSRIEFTIVGPVRDEGYWRLCQELIDDLPANVTADYLGGVPHEAVHQILADNDLFFLPTRGENFGHVIPEAMRAGTPVLVADTTPWRGLEEAGVGWDLPLAEPRRFVEKIEEAANRSTSEYDIWRRTVSTYASNLADPDAVAANRCLFRTALDDLRTAES